MHPHFDLPIKPVCGTPSRLTTGREIPQVHENQFSCSSSFTLGGARKLQDQAESNPRSHDLGNSISESRHTQTVVATYKSREDFSFFKRHDFSSSASHSNDHG